jgi:hypothetical protein
VLASTPGTSTATSRRVYPESFAPVDVLAKRADGLPGAVKALGLTGDAGIGVPVFLSATDGGHLRLSTFSLAAAMASVGAGESLRPHLFAGVEPPVIADGLRPDEVAAIKRQLKAGLAGDGKLWTAVLRGDLAVAVYDSEGDSAALMKRYLKGS